MLKIRYVGLIACLVSAVSVEVVGHLGGFEREGFLREMRSSVP